MKALARLLIAIAAIVMYVPVARANQNAQGWCESGAQVVVTSGLNSSTQVQASYPACTVTVLVHGAGTAQIFSDNNNTPLANPFTAQSNGRWLFYAANGRYDIVLSGAGFPTPVTYSDVVLSDSQVTNLALLPNTNVLFTPTPSFSATLNAAYTIVLTGNVISSSITGAPANGNLLAFNICEDGTGGHTFVFPPNFIIPPSFTFISTPTTCNYLSFKFDGVNWTFLTSPGGGGGGGSTPPGPPANALQYNFGGTFGGSNFLNLTNNTSLTSSPGTLITNSSSPSAIALTDPDNISQILMAVDGNNTDSTYLFVQGINNNPSPTAPAGGEVVPFGAWAWIGGPQNTTSGSGGGCFFYAPSNPPNCADAAFIVAGDVAGDANNGQDLVAVYTQIQLTKAVGQNVHKAVDIFVAPPGACFLAGTGGNPNCGSATIPAEKAGTYYGIEISDLRGVSSGDNAAIKIDSQTQPTSGTSFGIEAVAGSGINQLNDGIILGAVTAPLGATGKTALYMDATANWLNFKPNGNTAYLTAGITGTITPGAPTCATGTGGGLTTVGCGPFGGSNYQTVQGNGVTVPTAPILNLAQGTNMTVACSTAAGVTTCTLTSSATAATAFSALTASTNSNAGTFTATGNTWNYSGATAFTVPTAGLIFPGTVSGTMTLAPPAGALGALAVTIPAATDTLVNTSSTQTLINKSIAATEVNSGTLACAQLPAMTGDVTSSAGSCARTVVQIQGAVIPTSATLLGTNASKQLVATALTNGNVFIGNASNLPVGVLPAGDWTISNAGVTLVSRVNGVAYPAAPATNTVPVVTGANTITYEQVPNAALLNGGNVTVNGQACALGSSCNVNPGLATHTVAINEGNGVALSGVGPGTLGQAFISQGAADPVYGTLGAVGGGTGVSSPAAHAVAIAEGAGAFVFITPGAAGTCLTSNGTTVDPSYQTCASGGGGGNPMTLIGQMIGGGAGGVQTAIAAGLTGQSIIATNNAVPAFASPGLGGNSVTTTPYTVQCDTATSIVDRTLLKTFKTGASVVTVPDPTTSGCQGNFYFAVLNDGAGTLTFNRTTTAVFNIANGATNVDNANSFTLGNGQFAILNSPDNANWTVRIYASAGVTTFSGDGVLLTNSGSAGAVTATLGTAGAHQFFGNNTAAPATPAYFQPSFADIAFSLFCTQMPALTGDTTTVAGSCATTTAKINGTAFSGVANDVVAFGVGGIHPLDTGILYTNLVTAAANIASGNVIAGTGGAKAAVDSGVVAANLVTATANFVSANLIQGAGANKTASDSGIATANVVTAASNLTNNVVVAGNGTKGLVSGTGHSIVLPLACTGAGTGTAQTCSTSPTFVPAVGDTVIATVSTANTSDLTLNVNASVAAHVRKWLGTQTLVANDFPAAVPAILVYDGTFWEIQTIGNAPAGGGSGALSAILAAAGANTIANGNFPQTWNWAQSTNNQTAFAFGETSASTLGTLNANGLANQVELSASVASASTATPFAVVQGTVTGTVAFPAMQISTGWNNAGLIGRGIVFSVNNTASSAQSHLLDLNGGTGAATEFYVQSNGLAHATGGFQAATVGYTADAAGTSIVFQGGLDAGSVVTGGSGTFRGADNSNTTAASAGGLTVVRGGNETGATANATAGGVLQLFGGNTTSTSITATGGNVPITGGSCINVASATTCAGKVSILQPYFTTGGAVVNDLACVSAGNTIASCTGNGKGGFVGVIDSTSGSNVFIAALGIGGVHTFNATSSAFVTGHPVCQSTATNAANLVVDNGTLACPAGQSVGVYIDVSQTTATPLVWMAPTSGGSTVSSITGDGALITNSNSTGAVLLSLGSAGAHKYWGNNTGSITTPSYFQPAFTDLSGSIACTQLPALTGDTTTVAGSCATTTARINGLAVPASATVLGTNASTQPIAAATTGTGVTVVLQTNAVLTTPNLGTPSTLVLTNASGLPCSAKPAELGDVTSPAGSCTNTLATVNSNVGSFTNANITVNAKGLITAAASGSSGGTVAWSAISNPSANLPLSMGGFTSTFTYTSALANAFVWQNTTAATSGVSQSSPVLSMCGQGWETGTPANTADCTTIQQVIPNGANSQVLTTFSNNTSSTNALNGFSFNGNVFATGLIDGEAPVTRITSGCTTGAHCSLFSFRSGYTFTQFAAAATASWFDLPTVANTTQGMQYCVYNDIGSGGSITGIITITPGATAIITKKGVLGVAGHTATSTGAAGDGACFVATDTTHWKLLAADGSTWTLN